MESSVASSPHSHLRPESPHPGCASAARPPHFVGRRTSLPTRAARAQPDLPTSWGGERVYPPGLRERSPTSPLRGQANESPHPGCPSAARPPHSVGRRTSLPTRAAQAHAPLPNPLPFGERGSVRGGAGFHGGLGCCQARDRDPERAARNVVEPDAVAEVDRIRVAAVLAADPHLQLRPRLAALAHGQLHEPADTLFVNRLERVARKDLALEVADDEVALGVVA